MIICEILMFILICFLLEIKIHQGWDRSFKVYECVSVWKFIVETHAHAFKAAVLQLLKK